MCRPGDKVTYQNLGFKGRPLVSLSCTYEADVSSFRTANLWHIFHQGLDENLRHSDVRLHLGHWSVAGASLLCPLPHISWVWLAAFSSILWWFV